MSRGIDVYIAYVFLAMAALYRPISILCRSHVYGQWSIG